jgi:alanine racemase
MADSLYTAATRATWIEVDTAALVNNVKALNHLLAPPTRLMAVIKGNAYGHGAPAVAAILAQAGVEWLAVATPGEGLELRAQGITNAILVLGYTPPWVVATALAQQLTLTVDDQTTVDAIVQAATVTGWPAPVHVKVNTGMNRLGLQPEAVAPFLRMLQSRPGIVAEGIFTHFATADQLDNAFFEEQAKRFDTLLTQLTAEQLRPPLVHAANSATTLRAPHAHFDLVRCGIALYGLHPDVHAAPLPATFQPVLSWKAQVVHLTELQPGESVGYGRAFLATRPTTVATIPVGYADGFPRTPATWQTVLLHGQEIPLVGRVCMDQTVLDVSELVAQGKRVCVGDEVVLLGQQGACHLTAEEIGRRTGTINYEVVSRILPRVPRLIV